MVSLTRKCETTKLIKLNKGKWDSQIKTRKNTKRNEIFLLTKQNETKFRCFYCFAKQAKFRETIFFVSLCFVKQKKDAKWKP
jgi:hypothetical protein